MGMGPCVLASGSNQVLASISVIKKGTSLHPSHEPVLTSTRVPSSSLFHQKVGRAEIFPFKQPDTCVLRSGVDCWKRGKVNESISIMTRTGAKENRVYSFEVRYRTIRYFLPAAEGVRNPHFVLEEQD